MYPLNLIKIMLLQLGLGGFRSSSQLQQEALQYLEYKLRQYCLYGSS
jgi:hypothetical protein